MYSLYAFFVVFPVVFFCFSKVFDAKKYITITTKKREGENKKVYVRIVDLNKQH